MARSPEFGVHARHSGGDACAHHTRVNGAQSADGRFLARQTSPDSNQQLDHTRWIETDCLAGSRVDGRRQCRWKAKTWSDDRSGDYRAIFGGWPRRRGLLNYRFERLITDLAVGGQTKKTIAH